jgi:hypothetical protein
MAQNPLGIFLGKEDRPLGTLNGVRQPIDDNRPDMEEEKKREEKRAVLGMVNPLGRYVLGGYLKK